MNSAELVVSNLNKHFAGTPAVNELSLRVPAGGLTTLVGPSGGGKTTCLHLIAGLLTADSGSILLGGRDLAGVDPRHRDIAMVFQDGALYPHLTVEQNLAFPLKARGKQGKRAVPEMAERLGISALMKRKPSQISGGEARRVALGRALIRKPLLFLLDEPLAGLDLPLREDMRGLIRDLVSERKITTLFVTHDQADAIAIADQVAVMADGSILQVDTPQNIYSQPNHSFVAGFIGTPSANLMTGQYGGESVHGDWGRIPLAKRLQINSEVVLGFRPEDLKLQAEKTGICATVKRVEFTGSRFVVTAQAGESQILRFLSDSASDEFLPGRTVYLMPDPARLWLFDPATGQRL